MPRLGMALHVHVCILNNELIVTTISTISWLFRIHTSNLLCNKP